MALFNKIVMNGGKTHFRLSSIAGKQTPKVLLFEILG